MFKEEFEKKMKYYSREINLDLKEEHIEKFYIYMKLLLEWNEKINLTAIIDPEEIILKHFIDSLTIEKYLKTKTKLIDVGTGAGFPGIPLKILRDDIDVTLLDSLNKRVMFLNDVIEKLNLENIIAIHGRAEEIGQNKLYREQYDISTSRAVANLSTLSEYLIPMVKVEGRCICMKGSEIIKEIEDSKNAISILGGKVKEVDPFLLAGTEIKRNIVIIEKINNTQKKFPRKPGLPAKEPIL